MLELIHCPVPEGYHHTKWGSSAGLTVKRDDVTGLAPTGDLGLIDKSSFFFTSLLLMFGPDEEKNKVKQSANIQFTGQGEAKPVQIIPSYHTEPYLIILIVQSK